MYRYIKIANKCFHHSLLIYFKHTRDLSQIYFKSGIALQVARKIAQCDKAFMPLSCFKHGDVSIFRLFEP